MNSTDESLLYKMMLIRTFEEKAEELFMLGKVHGTMHLSIGQEATAVGVASALKEGDYLLNTHRGHGHCLAWFGSDVNAMMAEFMGKETGYCRGRGGSMHIANVSANNLGANGIVGGGLPLAIGVGLSIQMRKTDQVCAVIFGDGASNEGAFHESLNMASIWNLPVVYVCENNQYAMSMAIQKSAKIADISQRACAYGIEGVTVDGNDLPAVQTAIANAAAKCRAGQGPVLVECKTYRWRGHSKSDRQAYRTRDEVSAWQQRDPIRRLASGLGMREADVEAMRARARLRLTPPSPSPKPAPNPIQPA
jgi:pyruvate dehydrogenase E1 component alpha subunit